MTRLQLITAIKQEARIKSGTNLDGYVGTVMDEILTDHCNKTRYSELLKLDEPITLVAGQQSYDLPTDYQNFSAFRYGQSATPSAFRVLPPIPATVKKTSSRGLPMYHQIVQGRKVSLWPYADVQAIDTLLVDYYVDPLSVFSADGDEFPVAKLQSTVKKETIARVQRFHASLPEAQAMAQDAQSSFNATQGADK